MKQKLTHPPKETCSPPKETCGGSSDASSIDFALSAASLNEPEEHKLLGAYWNIKSDQFVFNLSTIVTATVTLIPTKRKAISLVVCFYDPLRFYFLLS